MWIARYKHSNSLKSLFGTGKNRAAALHKITFLLKKMSKMVLLLWILFPRQIGYILKNFTSFEIVQHIRKK